MLVRCICGRFKQRGFICDFCYSTADDGGVVVVDLRVCVESGCQPSDHRCGQEKGDDAEEVKG